MQSNLLERMNAQNLQSSVEASGQFELLVQDRNEQIGRHRDPDLRFYSIRTRAEIMFEAKVRFGHHEEGLAPNWETLCPTCGIDLSHLGPSESSQVRKNGLKNR